MTKFIVIEKDSLNKTTVDAAQIRLSEATIVHSKMSRDDVAEFIHDGDHLLLKLKNGEVIVIENFFVSYDDVVSDLVFEEEGCVLYWFDRVSGFNGISGLEVLLPEAGSQLTGLLPWLVGAGAVGGAVALLEKNKNKKESIPDGINTIEAKTDGSIHGQTRHLKDGTQAEISISGKDKDGNLITHQETVKVDRDGHYSVTVPAEFVDGDLKVVSKVIDRNGKTIQAESGLGAGTVDDAKTSENESAGLDRTAGSITVDLLETGVIIGTTTDVAANTDVVLTIMGKDADGNDVTISKTVQSEATGHYSSAIQPSDGIAEGSAVSVIANTIDRNGQAVPAATDRIAAQGDHDNDPSTAANTGLDVLASSISAAIDPKAGTVSGTVTDIPEGETVMVSIAGVDQDGQPVQETVAATVIDGQYTVDLPAAIADGSAVQADVQFNDSNGKPVSHTATLAGKTDHDHDPNTPDQGGLDRVDATISAAIDPKAGTVSGTVTDIPEGETVMVSIAGVDQDGQPVQETVAVTVIDGQYRVDLPAAIADGSAVQADVQFNDSNGKPVTHTATLAGKTDHDHDPNTPEQGGLDRVDGSITVDLLETGVITGTTTDVAANTDVVLTITGKDANGNDVTISKTVQTDAAGHYNSTILPSDGIAEGSAMTVVANTTDRNGQAVPLATDNIEAQVVVLEDGVIVENVLDNDNVGLTVTGIRIGDTTYNVGSNIDIPNVGTVNLATNGAYTFTPVHDYSGDVPAITYTVSNGTDADTANLNLEVVAVSDQPTTGNFEFDPPALSLNTQTWTNVKDINGNNLVENGGDGASKATLINAIDYLRNNSNVTNSDHSAVGTAGTGVTNSLSDTSLPTFDAVYISGYVFLEAGQTYLYSGLADDSAAIVIGDGVSSLHVNWIGTSTSGDGEFSVTQSGYYSFQFYAHNARGTGHYDFTVQNSDGSAMKYYPDLTAIRDSLQDTSYILGDHDVGSDGRSDTGFYPVNMGYQGLSTDVIELTGINLKATDTDGSEYLSFTMSGVPAGAVLSFKDALGNEHSVTAGLDGTVNYIPEDKDSGTTEYTSFTLTVGDKTNELLDVALTVTSTEKSNEDSLSSTLGFEVNVTDAVDTANPTPVVNNMDNNVVATSDNDLVMGDTGGLKTNFVAGQDYNVSIVLDLSGSMGNNMDGNLIFTSEDSRLDIAKKGLKAFIQQMAEHDGVLHLQIASFSSRGNIGNSYNQVFSNVSKTNVDEIFTFIDNLRSGGGTQPEYGFNKAVDWFDTVSSEHVENQTYYLTDGEPNSSQTRVDTAFAPLAAHSKVFAVGISNWIEETTVSRYDNTDIEGNKLTGVWDGDTNHGTALVIGDADKLVAYIIGGSENFVPTAVGSDTLTGKAGEDVLFGDAINTDWITGLDPLQYPQYSGYSKLLAHLKATETGGAEPTQQQVYDFMKGNIQQFVDADATDLNSKGGNDNIYGDSGHDILIAGAGDDRLDGGSGDDLIFTGRGQDSIVYNVLQSADATANHGTDTWADYDVNDQIEFAADFFEGLLADKSNISEYLKVEDVNGKAVLKVDRDGTAATGGTTHDWADLLVIEAKTSLELQDFVNNQIIIG